MQRCSESVAAIATALAKAQIELTNPEKSMVGSITHNNRDYPQTFRYAPLSGGLEIIRKTLGAQQIAVAQSTAIDQANKIVNLTTTLMHTSGEWISSDWPVCQLSETAAPRRMGAALSYARRYALFTLVGIAGEDDLDAPEFQTNNAVTSQPISAQPPLQTSANQPPAPHIQNTAEATSLFEQLQSEIAAHTSIEELQARAAGILKAKNTLSTEDAKAVGEAFAAKLASLPTPTEVKVSKTIEPKQPKGSSGKTRGKRNGHVAMPPRLKAQGNVAESESIQAVRNLQKIEKSELAIGEPRRHRDKNHLRFVAGMPCVICARTPSDAHHLRFVQPRAMGRKTSDEFTVPLCRTHHRDNHRFGDEPGWWAKSGIDPLQVAGKLWQQGRNIEHT